MNWVRPLTVGVLHSFEPDHLAAVSVLASEQAESKMSAFKIVWRASQWALGHSATLLIFGGVAIAFKASMGSHVSTISDVAAIVVGPVMIWLGIEALRRNRTVNTQQLSGQDLTEKGENRASSGRRSFGIGMLHGLAGTSAAATAPLILQADTTMDAVMVIVIESLAIIGTMAVYGFLLVTFLAQMIRYSVSIYKWINGIAGVISIVIGIIFLLEVFNIQVL